MSRTALIDGDVVVYKAGFGSDAVAKAHGKTHEPLEYCLHAVKETLTSLMDETRSTDAVVFLSHPVNFRELIFPDYKANRDVNHKPYWYPEIRDYLLDYWDAQYSLEGDEADDALGIAQMQALVDDRETIIVTNDKDLDMIPGLHFNFSKTKKEKGVYETEDPEGLRLFYRQMLTGDSTDNIPGMFRKMKVKATSQWLDPLDGMTRNTEMLAYIRDVYKDDEFVQMIGSLLWIKREAGAFWGKQP